MTADFIATLTYRTTEQGGRKTSAKSGYRPQVKFDFEEMQTSGQQTFIDKELVFPGETVDAEIRILAVDYFAGKLAEGMEFEFMWTPISLSELEEWILRGELELKGELLNFWNLIKIKPQKWQEKEYGDEGGGFWVVAVLEVRLFITMTLTMGLISQNMKLMDKLRNIGVIKMSLTGQ